jgi:hypothetical protein
MMFWEKLFSAHATVSIERATTFNQKPVRESSLQAESLLQWSVQWFSRILHGSRQKAAGEKNSPETLPTPARHE